MHLGQKSMLVKAGTIVCGAKTFSVHRMGLNGDRLPFYNAVLHQKISATGH
jgi:hypothetical protein